ncbi:ATP-dependent DNA helicase II subunit 2, partial [Ascosphaera aggregata]
MSEKEATVYIVDVGRQMGQVHSGRSISDLDYAMTYVWDKITYAVSVPYGRKTLNIGVIGLKTDDTSNAVHAQTNEEVYEHISVFQEIKQTLMPDIRSLKKNIKPSNTDIGDGMLIICISFGAVAYGRKIAISAIIVAISMLEEKCKKLKYIRRIVLVTDGRSPMEASDLGKIAAKMNDEGIELLVLGVDFDDPEYGVKEEDKPPQKAHSERIFHTLADDCGGMCGTVEEAVTELAIPRPKDPPRPINMFKGGNLMLGNYQQFDTAITINVERYFRTYEARPPTSSAFVPTTSRVGAARKVQDEDENEMTAYDRYMSMSNSQMVVGSKLSEADTLALSSIIHALNDLQCFAVGRLVPKDGKPPALVVLAPYIEENFECLTEVQVPFAEDIRTYRFPPLDKIVTVSGKEVYEHRNLPSKDLLASMERFVDKMELSGVDEDGQRVEMLPMDEYFSPVIHRLQQAIKLRAIDAKQLVPELPEAIIRLAKQPKELQERSKESLKKLIQVADIKKVPPRTKGRKRDREAEKPLSGLDVEGLLGKRQKTLDPNNAIPQYKQRVADMQDTSALKEATEQLFAIVENRIKNSLGDQNYERAIEELRVMRDEHIDYEEARTYNEMITRLKGKIVKEELNGDRRE